MAAMGAPPRGGTGGGGGCILLAPPQPNVVRTLVLDEMHTHSLPVSSHTLRLLKAQVLRNRVTTAGRDAPPAVQPEVDHDLRVQSDLCANLPTPGVCRGPVVQGR